MHREPWVSSPLNEDSWVRQLRLPCGRSPGKRHTRHVRLGARWVLHEHCQTWLTLLISLECLKGKIIIHLFTARKASSVQYEGGSAAPQFAHLKAIGYCSAALFNQASVFLGERCFPNASASDVLLRDKYRWETTDSSTLVASYLTEMNVIFFICFSYIHGVRCLKKNYIDHGK